MYESSRRSFPVSIPRRITTRYGSVLSSDSSNRIRMYPSLVNCTTIDLFADWPHDALLEVGERYLAQIDLAGDDKVRIVSKGNSFSSF